MVKPSYIYGCSVYYINGQILLHLWFVDLLHLWLKVITFMVSITFMVGITFMGFITFMGDTTSYQEKLLKSYICLLDSTRYS